MGLYGSYIEEDKSLLEYVNILEYTIDCLFESDNEFISESEMDILSEGKSGTIEIVKRFKEINKEYKKQLKVVRLYCKAAKASGKKEDYTKAKKSIDELIKLLTKYKKEISDIDSGSALDILTGFVLVQIPIMVGGGIGSILGVGIGALMSKHSTFSQQFTKANLLTSFGAGTIITNLIVAVDNAKRAIKNKDTKELNACRTEVITWLGKYINVLNKIKNELEKVFKEN